MENFVLALNYEGVDYQVEVPDLETANLLLNDPDAASQYLEKILQEQSSKDLTLEANKSVKPCIEAQTKSTVSFANSSTVSPSQNAIIWTTKKQSARDLEATALMLSSRERMGSLFDDKKTRKVKLWNDIAKILEENGFCLGEKGGERCCQKFANLQKAYLLYIKHQKTTGSERNDELPSFFEELHSILGGKHKVNPAALEDSMDVDHETTETVSPELQFEETGETTTPNEIDEATLAIETEDYSLQQVTPSTSKDPSRRFKKIKRRVTPSSRTEDLVNELQKDRATRAEEVGFLKSHLKNSEDQRERFLNILERAFLPKRQKRETDSSDSE